MKLPHPSQPDRHDSRFWPVRSLLQQSALLRGLGALALCAALTTVLVWATRPIA